jgi:hypothetical protein
LGLIEIEWGTAMEMTKAAQIKALAADGLKVAEMPGVSI